MKKKFKFVTLATMLIVAAGIVTFVACNKKNEMVKDIPEWNAKTLTQMDKEMVMFGEKLKSATKGVETMPLEEAVLNLINYQNFKMSDVSIYSTDMKRITLKSDIRVNDGNVYLSDMNLLYESNKKQIVDFVNSLNGDNRTIYCISCKINDENKEYGIVEIVTDAYVYGSIPGPTRPCSIDATDYWHPIDREGKCGLYSGLCIGRDAITELNSLVSCNLGEVSCQDGYRAVPYNFDWFYIIPTDYPDTNSPNGCFGLIDGLYDQNCLSPSDLTYYMNSILNKLNEGMDSLDKYVISCSLYQVNTWCVIDALMADIECTLIGPDI